MVDGTLGRRSTANLLPPGDYVLTVGKGALSPPDRLASYRFRAVR